MSVPDAPHPVLREYYREDEYRAEILGDLFDSTAEHYDWLNSLLSFGTGRRYRGDALRRAGLEEGMKVLDVGAGTGVIAEEAAMIVGEQGLVTAVDPSTGMREIAKRKRGVLIRQGRAECLPLESSQYDFLVMGYALRHVESLTSCFAEFARVLRPGGRLLLLEITKPRSRAGNLAARLYFRELLPRVGRLFSREPEVGRLWRYHWDSIVNCTGPETIIHLLRQAGFPDVQRSVSLGLFSEYVATNRET